MFFCGVVQWVEFLGGFVQEIEYSNYNHGSFMYHQLKLFFVFKGNLL